MTSMCHSLLLCLRSSEVIDFPQLLCAKNYEWSWTGGWALRNTSGKVSITDALSRIGICLTPLYTVDGLGQ